MDIRVYITGPSSEDVAVYAGPYRIGLLQQFELELSAQRFVPYIAAAFPSISFVRMLQPEVDGDVLEVHIENGFDEIMPTEVTKISTKYLVKFNHEILGTISRFRLASEIQKANVVEIQAPKKVWDNTFMLPSWVDLQLI
jgi:hypothetical protein